jgi:hypothetical protein
MILAKFPVAAVLLAAAFIFSSVADAAPSSPVWEWKAEHEADKFFDGTRSLEFPEVRKLYQARDGFSVEVRLKPENRDGAGGIVSDYADSRMGGWYLSTGDAKRPMRPVFVAIDQTPYPGGYRKLDASRNLRVGEWQTLLLVSDGTFISLFLNGREMGKVSLNQPLLRPSVSSFTVGKRGNEYFKGEIESVRLWNQPIAAASGRDEGGVEVNYLSNSSFENGDKIEDVLLWHRMAGTSPFVKTPAAWAIDDTTAHHGKRSLRGGAAEPLVLMEEAWEKIVTRDEIWSNAPVNDPWVFSVYLKADREGVPCELSVGAYRMLNEQTVSKRVELTTEWKRYDLVVRGIPNLYRRYMDIHGPLNFRIHPKAEGVVWVDAAQWSKGERVKGYSPDGPEALTEAAPPLGVPKLEVRRRPDGEKSSWTGTVPIRVFREGTGKTAGRQPVTVGIPFNRGAWDGRGRVSLRNEAGQPIDVQTEVFTHWSGSQGVQILGLFFTDELVPGWQNYTMEIESGPRERPAPRQEGEVAWMLKPAATPGQLWQGITDAQGRALFEAASLRAVDINGRVYDSQWDGNAEWSVERDGPLHRTYRGAGRMMDREGRGLLAYVARVHVWRDVPGVKLEVSLVNSRSDNSVRVRSIYWHTKEGAGNKQVMMLGGGLEQPAQGRFEATSLADVSPPRYFIRYDTPKETVTRDGRAPLSLTGKAGERTILAHAPEAWQRNPVALAWEDGEWRGYFWPDNATRGLSFPRGVALTREFWLRDPGAATGDLQAWDTPAFGMAAPQWWATTDVMISFSATDSKRFPFIEQKLSGEKLLGRIAPAKVDETNAYGAFDYGDSPGDGGWSNLESFTDWSALLAGLRSGGETALAIGLRSARHYRDVDMNQTTGATYMHNINHHLGWFDMSHSWPEGLVMHYLLTGSKRSEEMILKHGEYLINMNKAELARGLRTLGRYFTNLANIYQLTGDDQYKKRFFDQLKSNIELLEADPENPDRSIFSDIRRWKTHRLVPYHTWYGVSALQKMASLTGDPALGDLVSKEIAASLNPDLYAPGLTELWPGVPPEKGMPLMVADFARGRGNFFYPVMTKEAEIRGDAKLGKLALDSLYAWAVEGRSSGIQAILASAPLKFVKEGQTEEELISAAADLIWDASAETLLNGDFSRSDKYWHHWRPLPNKELAINWETIRAKMVALDSGVRKTGPRSLRFNLTPDGFNRSISVDTHRFRLAPGKYVLRGWLRWDKGATPPAIGMEVRDLRGRFETWTLQAGEQGHKPVSGTSTVKTEGVSIAAPDAEGWRRMEIRLAVQQRSVGNLLLTGNLRDGAKTGYLWVDGFRLEKLK